MTVNPQSLSNTPVWDDLTWRALAPLDSDLTTDVCVIGLGGSGLTAVSELLDLGRRVVGIDAADVAAGAAGRNGGFLLGGTADFHHDAVAAIGHARALRIHQLTLEEIRRIADQAPGTVRFPGSLRIAESDEEFADCARQRDAMRADGIPVEDYAGRFGRGLFFPGDASFNPLARCRALALRNIAGGAQLFAGTRALSFSAHEVATAYGRIRCDQVIVAVDGRLEALVPELAGRVRTARLQMLGTAPTREIEIPCPGVRPIWLRLLPAAPERRHRARRRPRQGDRRRMDFGQRTVRVHPAVSRVGPARQAARARADHSPLGSECLVYVQTDFPSWRGAARASGRSAATAERAMPWARSAAGRRRGSRAAIPRNSLDY